MRKLQREDDSSPFTWRTPGALAARLEVPVAGAWERLNAGPKRRTMLEGTLSSQAASQGIALGICGPPMCGKSQVALALADLRGLRAVYATEQTEQQAFKPQPGLLVIVDPVSAYPLEEVQACLNFYRNHCPILLVDRDEGALAQVGGISSIIRLRLPSAQAVSAYLQELLADYPHQLTEQDFSQLGEAMNGLSLPQVNQIAVDAALSRLQYGEAVDRRSLDGALSSNAMIRSHLGGAA